MPKALRASPATPPTCRIVPRQAGQSGGLVWQWFETVVGIELHLVDGWQR